MSSTYANEVVFLSVGAQVVDVRASDLTGLFVISGYSGKASGRFFGRFGGDFPVVFVSFPDEISRKNPLKPF